MEGDITSSYASGIRWAFQSTPSAWRETFDSVSTLHLFSHFNPLPPHGGRLRTSLIGYRGGVISIHSLRMEGDFCVIEIFHAPEFISIHSLRMEGDVLTNWRIMGAGDISIHSLRMEGDVCRISESVRPGNFNPLPPHGGRRQEVA